jgi:nicotinamidase-related amidase
MQTEYGIDATCRGASALGYQVTLVRDGHSTYDADDLPAAEVIVRHNVSIGTFAAVIESDAIDFRQGSGRGS